MFRPTGSMSNHRNRRHESQQTSPEMESAIGYHHAQQPSIYAVQSDGLFDLFVAKHTVDFSLKRQLLSRNGFMIPWEKFSQLSCSVVGQKKNFNPQGKCPQKEKFSMNGHTQKLICPLCGHTLHVSQTPEL
ncbi:unnamed protein product [Porites evermanni]|uniref:Uncharacterized protein n=1 Tax=Porites evermanni TaxID=104178 RepID=A0ABN8MBS5_9CNID|nr:unnamed protein product [Porites evermanni]